MTPDLQQLTNTLATHSPGPYTFRNGRNERTCYVTCRGCDFQATTTTTKNRTIDNQVTAELTQAFARHQADMIAPLT